MARICFAWELGQGLGHLVRYIRIIERLCELGHEVEFMAKLPERAAQVFAGMPVQITAVQPGWTPPGQALRAINSYPEILCNFGFHDARLLAAQTARWLDHFAAQRPDVLIIDHCPTALLAKRILGIPSIGSGTGFTLPPRRQPMSALRYWTVHQREKLAEREQLVMANCNEVLALHQASPLPVFADLLETTREWFLTFGELDHYGQRDGTRYLGTFPVSEYGQAPSWRDEPGPKLFAYLTGSTLPEPLIKAIDAVAGNLCVYAPRLEDAAFAKLNPRRTERMTSPVALADVVDTAQIAITNGGLNTVAGLLLAGIPQLVIADNMERHMLGRRLELMGGGLMATAAEPGLLPAKLAALLRDRAFARAARHFSTRYATRTAAQQTDSMLADINHILSAGNV